VSADATSGRVTSIAPTLTGEVRVKSELLELRYPVCTQHAKGIAAFNFATRNTAGLRALRVFLYCFGPASILVFLRRLVPGLHNVALPFDFAALLAACAAAFVFVVVAFRKLPVRVVSLSEDAISVRFKNLCRDVRKTQHLDCPAVTCSPRT
jgi:hypothetical protein